MPHLVVQDAKVRVADQLHDEYIGVRFVSGPDRVLPDEPCDCVLELMYYPNVDYRALTDRATFTVREGGKVVAFGTVNRWQR